MKETGFEEALATSQKNTHSKWPERRVENRLEPECWPGLKPSFTIEPGAKIFAIGSCFARHIERYLALAGFDVPTRRFLQQTHFAHDVSGEILNKYTPPSIHQELSWTKQILDRDGVVQPEDIEAFLLPLKSGKVMDLQRRFVDRFGTTREEALEQRQVFFDLFKEAFDAQVVVITLGLVECWWDSTGDQYIEMSAALADYNQDRRFSFRRLDYPECYDFTKRTIDLLNSTGEKHILITTSPIPIVRTFTADDVIVANTYSKSVLRAVAGKVAEETPRVDYFPSYESVMLTRRPELWEDDLAHVEGAFIERIMRRVQEAYVPGSQSQADSRLDDAISRLSSLVKHEQWSQAGEVLTEISALRSDVAQFAPPFAYYISAAAYLIHSGQRDLAREHLEKVESLSRQPVRNLAAIRAEEQFHCARLWDALGGGERAGNLRRVALEGMLDRPNALKSWIRTLLKAGLVDDALTGMVFAEQQPDVSGDVLDYLAHVYQGLERLDDADRLLAAALALEPDSALIRTRRVALLLKLGRGPEAAALVEGMDDGGGGTTRYLRKVAAGLVKDRRGAEAEPSIARLLALEPDEPQNHALLARCLMQAGRPEEALTAAARAQALRADERFQRLIDQAESAIALKADGSRDKEQTDPAKVVA